MLFGFTIKSLSLRPPRILSVLCVTCFGFRTSNTLNYLRLFTILLIPSFIRGTFQFSKYPNSIPLSLR